MIGPLFCLMCVVAGFRECGLLDWLSGRVLGMASHARTVSLLFVILCFFCSMLLTNDVTLMADSTKLTGFDAKLYGVELPLVAWAQ